jgi:hypothetical protein
VSPAEKPPHEINEDSPLSEMATLVCSRLEADGISVVLSGGAAVSIYSENEYESYDLDCMSSDHFGQKNDFAKRQFSVLT